MDVMTRSQLILDALTACSVDLDCAVQLVAPHSAPRHYIETSRIPWGAPPRFVQDGPGMSDESGSVQ